MCAILFLLFTFVHPICFPGWGGMNTQNVTIMSLQHSVFCMLKHTNEQWLFGSKRRVSKCMMTCGKWTFRSSALFKRISMFIYSIVIALHVTTDFDLIRLPIFSCFLFLSLSILTYDSESNDIHQNIQASLLIMTTIACTSTNFITKNDDEKGRKQKIMFFHSLLTLWWIKVTKAFNKFPLVK